MVIHYMVYQPPDENWQLACLCDDLLPEIVTVRRDNVTCLECLQILSRTNTNKTDFVGGRQNG